MPPLQLICQGNSYGPSPVSVEHHSAGKCNENTLPHFNPSTTETCAIFEACLILNQHALICAALGLLVVQLLHEL
jgi:hypothetical protein